MNEDNAEEALSRPLLDEPPPPAYEDLAVAAEGESSSPPPPSYSELGESNPESNSSSLSSCRSKLGSRLRKIPTIAYILIATIGFLILMFLSAAVFFPPSTKIPDTTNHTNHTMPPPPLTEGSVRDGDGPKGIHISFTESPSEMHIQFSTQNIGKPVVELAAKDNPTETKKFDGTSTTYLVTEMCEKNKSADVIKKFIPPGQLHTVRITDLKPRTEYIYRAGISTGQGIDWGDFIEFRSPTSPGYISPNNMNATKPLVTFLALADQGTDGAAKNVSNLITTIVNNTNIDSIHIIGDLSYADGYTQIWGNYMDMIEPFASRVPTMVAVGNHEYDYDTLGDGSKDASGVNTSNVFHPSWGGKAFHDEGGECGVSIAKRFAAPNNGNKIFWYSFKQELVHTVVLSSEHNMTVGSPQYAFLEKDLSSINRTITPWVVVDVHRPLYNSEKYWTQDAVGLGMRNEIEELLYMNKVDLVLSGHYHGYLRSCDGVYREKCSSGGPMHITLGTGGRPLDCHKSLIPNHYTDKFDGCNFGVGRINVYNASALHFEFVTLGEVVLDDVWLVRQRAS